MTDTNTKIEFYEKDNDRNKSLPKMSNKTTEIDKIEVFQKYDQNSVSILPEA